MAYDPHRLVQLADWTSFDAYEMTLGSAHEHVAVLSAATLTELSDGLKVLSVNETEGKPGRTFVEDPETGGVVMGDGMTLFTDGTYRKIWPLAGVTRMRVSQGRVVVAVSSDVVDLGWFNLRRARAGYP